MDFLVADLRLAYPVGGLFLQEDPEEISQDFVCYHLFDEFVVVFFILEYSFVGGDCLLYPASRDPFYFVRLQVREEGLAEVFCQVFCVSDFLRSFVFAFEFLGFLENIYFFVLALFFSLVLVIAIIGGGRISVFPGHLLDIGREVQGIVVLDDVLLVFVKYLGALLDDIAGHLAEVVLDLQLGGELARGKREVEAVLVVPIEPLEGKLLLGQYFFGEDAVFPHYLELV